jgi:hypothetical protein
MLKSGESEQPQPVPAAPILLKGVSAETVKSRCVTQRVVLPASNLEFSTAVRSVVRNPSSECCVSSVPSAVALSKRIPELRAVLRTSEWRTRVKRTELRISEWRKSVPSSVSVTAVPPASPKDTLRCVFENLKRAARVKKSERISQRLAPPSRVEFLR